MPKRGVLVFMCAVGVLASPLGSTVAVAQSGSNVLLVVNESSADSKQIGDRYARARSVPAENILRLSAPLTEDVDRPEFERSIEMPIANWITRQGAQDRILYFVLTKGIPLRIRGTGGATATTASVDSELTLLYRKLVGTPVQPAGPLPNPYFLGDREVAEARPFSHATADMYLVSRLDGFRLEDIFGLIDRGAAPRATGEFLLDQKATLVGERSGDDWLAAAATRLRAAGLGDRVVLNASSEVVTGRKDVLGYYSWGSNDPAIKRRRLDLGFAPGALAATFVSSDARTFKAPPDSWTLGTWADRSTHFEGSPQSLTGDLIAEGATGAAGHVAEPYLGAAIRPQILFPAYTRGFNLIESFYLAMPYLSWQTVVIGDPLCAPFPRKDLPADEALPPADPDTELPRYFSGRRLSVLEKAGFSRAMAAILLKVDTRLIRDNRSGAVEALRSAKLVDVQAPGALLAFAMLFERARGYDEAIDLYRRTLSAAPNNVPALNNLAYMLAVHKQNPREALPLAMKAYDIAKGASQVADTVGWIHHLLGNDAEAEKFLTQAAAGLPGSAEVQLHLAAVEAARGLTERAKASLDRALRLDPRLETSDDARALRGKLAK